ncbi:LppP/LprE family lipoprotein [Nocardia sp. XZ_19_385]|uniref:LppP/LprE family lipoprotein n=1 Tax=Nocardia sp. XZ_19_385 TaxID=2769488 RepID=UPI00188E734D|nr:LppP/LprE family lipoprotein [Nocardia sp. XZ_19_385]
MGIKPAVIAVAAGIALAATGCGDNSPAPSAPGTPSRPSSVPVTPPQPGTANNPTAPEAPPTEQPPTPATAQPGSGHGYCFDLNSELAHSAFTQVIASEPATEWTIPGASEDLIADGCSGVLSWMTVEGTGIHPATHVLFFTGGKYLGTASKEPYGYTHVLGKTRNTVQVQYRWPLAEDALCCPTGGPSVVTFTLNGTSVTAQGQFPPS